ncbi:hypothetical protein BGZ50_001115, partial [Haplosporangium sp. Z 11]
MRSVGVNADVVRFIQRLQQLGVHTPARASAVIRQQTDFQSSIVVRSVASQLSVELKRMYTHGSHQLVEKLVKKQEKDDEISVGIREDWSAVENFVKLNRLDGSNRRIVPMSRRENGFVSLSEIELLQLFWRKPNLQTKIREMTAAEFPNGCALQDLTEIWLRDREPGFLIKQFLSNVAPEGLSKRKRGKIGYRAAVEMKSIDGIKDHLRTIRQPGFDPAAYNTKGYLLRGSIRTDGFTLQLLGFKLKELQSVRFKRLPEDLLPPQLT